MIAISTAYKQALIAIDINGKQDYKVIDSNCKHSENLLYNIDKMLDNIGCTIKDNDCYSVIIGPGSFTGIRIGIALIKGLNKAYKNKLIALTTFDLMAYSYCKNNNPEKDFYCVIDALSGLTFACKFNKHGQRIEEERLINQEELKRLNTITIGLSEEKIGDIKITPTPQELLEISNIYLNKNNITDDEHLLPLYLRKSQAEASLESKNKN